MSSAVATGRASGELGRASISAVIWGAGGSIVRIAVQVVAQIVLARLLGPEPFGLFAIGLVVVFFSGIFADAGLCYGLIQRKTVTEDDIRFVFTWQMLIAGAVTALLMLAAPAIAAAYADNRLIGVLRVLSALVLINASGATASMLCRRELDFKTLHIATVVGYGVGFFAVGIPMALLGFGVEALIAAFLLQALIASGLTFARRRHSVLPLLVHRDARAIFAFGAAVLATRLAIWVSSSLDRTIIGATLGLTAAGLYATMHTLINAPAMNAIGLLQSVFYSAGAKMQGSREQLARGFRTMIAAVSLCLVPVFVAIAMVPETVILALLGSEWISGAPALRALALAVPSFMLIAMSTPVLWNTGQTWRELQLEMPLAAILGVAILAAARSGSLAVVAWVVCAVFHLRAVVIIGAAARSVGLHAREVAHLLGAGVGAALMVAPATFAADRAAGVILANPQLRLLLVVVASAAAFAAALRIVRQAVRPEVKAMLVQLSDREPTGRARRLVNALLAV